MWNEAMKREPKIIKVIDRERAKAGAKTIAKLEKEDTKHIQQTEIIYTETR